MSAHAAGGSAAPLAAFLDAAGEGSGNVTDTYTSPIPTRPLTRLRR